MTKKKFYIIFLAFAVLSCNNNSKESRDIMNTDTAINNTNPQAPTQQSWMDKIGDEEWIDNSTADHKLVFGKLTTQAGSITGELKEHFPGLVNVCMYESVTDGVLNIHLIKTIQNGTEELRTSITNLKLQLTDEGNTLVINYPDDRILRYSRSQNSNPKLE